MNSTELPISVITPASWNPNEMTPEMRNHLKRSIERFGLVVPLVVRSIDKDRYETIGGAQRMGILQELDITPVPCVVVKAADNEARLLSQALNRIAGSDNLGLRAELLGTICRKCPKPKCSASCRRPRQV